ncbi:hypothetical protein MSAN_02282000 [Mycena sanguinolenta]|uniref:Protein kinase domain-containing protein n=1 Tax=Mycena sanguinolenta TaxID=230812 RepID=A0A8H6XB76_9AGAR|nr:hypothetical protein MSAN_02282000 [Mycena sanguinolenta]
MDPQADSDEDFIVLSTLDYTESTSKPTRNVESFIKSFSFLPSLRKGRFQTWRTSEAHTQKYSETKSERQAIQHLVNNYYHIIGGFGGSGGEGGEQGGSGGTGQGPTVYFGQPQEREPSGIQTIRLEDINLMRTIRLDPHSDVGGVGVRRIYHAEIRRDPGIVTVAVYQGDGAEEEWQQDIAKYESIRHPNIMQLYGLVSTKNLYAMIFHNGIFQLDSQHGTCVRITEPLQILPEEKPHWDNYTKEAPGELLPNLWIRYDFPRMFALKLELNLWFPSYEIQKAWLAQANHMFAKLQEWEHIEDYVCVDELRFCLQIADKHNIPKGYLFVCPPRDFHTNTEPHANLYQWPACPAYWSLDPSGADRLSMEDAKNLGFPAIHIETLVFGQFWGRSVYEGLRRFHEGKGFDPDSREVARQLGYPLLEVSSERVLFPAREVNNEPYSWRCKQDDPALCRSLSHYL